MFRMRPFLLWGWKRRREERVENGRHLVSKEVRCYRKRVRRWMKKRLSSTHRSAIPGAMILVTLNTEFTLISTMDCISSRSVSTKGTGISWDFPTLLTIGTHRQTKTTVMQQGGRTKREREVRKNSLFVRFVSIFRPSTSTHQGHRFPSLEEQIPKLGRSSRLQRRNLWLESWSWYQVRQILRERKREEGNKVLGSEEEERTRTLSGSKSVGRLIHVLQIKVNICGFLFSARKTEICLQSLEPLLHLFFFSTFDLSIDISPRLTDFTSYLSQFLWISTCQKDVETSLSQL